jgi:N-acetylneuraminic acid mutarotase
MERLLKKIIIFTMMSFTILSAGEWKDTGSLNTPRAGAAAVVWHGKIFVFGGKSLNNNILKSVEVYDTLTQTWDSTIVEPFKQKRYNTSAIVWKNKIFLTGGRTNNDVLGSVEIYDPVQNKWEEAQDLHEEREGHSINIFNEQLYVFGGQESSFNYVDEIEKFDPQKDKWVDSKLEMENQRSAHFAVVYDTQYYMFGGYYLGLTNTIFKTVPDSDSYAWAPLGTLSEPRAYGATAQIDSLIYILGGETPSGKTKRVEIYDAKNDSLYFGDDLATALSGIASVVLNNKIYLIGGFEGSTNDIINNVQVYTPTVTAIANANIKQPSQILLAKAYPNPFNGRVKIDVNIPLREQVQIDVLNVLGQNVRNLQNPGYQSGKYSFHWDAKDRAGRYVSSGLYLISVKTKTQLQILKITYVK